MSQPDKNSRQSPAGIKKGPRHRIDGAEAPRKNGKVPHRSTKAPQKSAATPYGNVKQPHGNPKGPHSNVETTHGNDRTPHDNPRTPQKSAGTRRPDIKLPFENGRRDVGEWVYENRTPLSITIIVYLVSAIIFLSVNIIIDRRKADQAIVLDIEEFDKLQKQLDQAEELNDKLNESAEWETPLNVRNAVSNENANMEQIHAEDRQLQEDLRESRKIYEESLREQQQLFEQAPAAQSDQSPRKDVKVDGRVTVSFSLMDPIRHAAGQGLVVPAYMCDKAGKVVVSITVNRNGDVTEASVVKAASTSDHCMTSTAVNSAYRSRFNVDGHAPAKHKGTITYIFISQ